ncbi:DUF177 domain-containing protein [bacterium]|nr:DUF177 domain-containing protein [bacterium]
MLREIVNIKEGIHDFCATSTPGEMELDYGNGLFTEPVIFKGTENRKGDDIIIKGVVKTEILVNCVRCLKDFRYSLCTKIQLYVKLVGGGSSCTVVWQDDYVRAQAYGTLDLSPRIRDALIIELPLKPLCSDDCRGLCPVCGMDLNKGTCNCTVKEPSSVWNTLEDLKGKNTALKKEGKNGPSKEKNIKIAG